MPPNRLISLPGSGPLLQVHPLEDGVLAIPLLDAQHGLLELPLPGVGGLIRLLPRFSGGVVGEQIQLLRLVPPGGLRLVQQLVGADAQAAEQLDLFTDYASKEKQEQADKAAHTRERKLQEAMLGIKKKYGKNAILKGINLEDGATARERNQTIGGHQA